MELSEELLEALSRVRAVVSDVDGTLTVARGDYRLSPRALEAIWKLEEAGVRVVLATGNSLPVALALARYTGARGPVVAENGCLVAVKKGEEVLEYALSPRSCRDALEVALKAASGLVQESWQNPYRRYDYALIPIDHSRAWEAVERIRKALDEAGLSDVRVTYSGFAIHIYRGHGKKAGVLKALELIGVDPGEAAGIGDGANDVELLEAVGLKAAVANADSRLKSVADIVLSKPSGEGFAELADMILKAKKLQA